MTADETRSHNRLSRRKLLALPAAGIAATLPAAVAAAAPSPLPDLIDRHRSAAAALEEACRQLEPVARKIGQDYPAEVCKSWLGAGAGARKQWLRVRKTHGIDALERERQRLDKAEKDAALDLLASPVRTIEEARLKARYVREADILRENLLRDEGFVEALLKSLC
jgi:hypothetical protein